MLGRDPLRDPEHLIREVYAYVSYRIGPGADAEDITSEVFERALRYRDSYRPSAGSPIAWLVGISSRCIADAMRGSGLRADADVERLAGATGDFAGDVAARSDVRAAVAQLDERDRELIALRYGADLKAKEIAQVLEMKTNAVEVALHRALARLRVTLEGPAAGADAGPAARRERQTES
jgi:RNA polymerase sigma-70 factor (ECF subfamily)